MHTKIPKSFLRYLKENPLLSDMPDVGYKDEDNRSIMGHVANTNERLSRPGRKFTSTLRSLGNLGRDYRIVHSEHTANSGEQSHHQFFVVHKKTGQLAGRFLADRHKDTEDEFEMSFARIHPEHRGKGLGHDFYKKLLDRGHTLVSDSLQTHGGAKIWQKLLSNPELRERASLFSSEGIPQQIPKENEEIWSNDENDHSRIRITGKKRKPKNK
jgi:GNAT superfamily N-acetyltransferase